MSEMRPRESYPLVVAVAVIAIYGLSELLAIRWFEAFISSGTHHQYLAVFYVILFICLLLTRHLVTAKSLPKVVLTGAVVGYGSGFVASILAGLFLPDGIERYINTFQQLEITDVVLVWLWAPLLLGGWLLGIVLTLIVRFAYLSRGDHSEKKSTATT